MKSHFAILLQYDKMVSDVALKYLHKTIRRAHATYQSPLIWDERQRRFIQDESTSYRIGSICILSIDIFTTLALFLASIVNSSAGLSSIFTLVLLVLGSIVLQNTALDVNAILFPYVAAENAFISLATSNPGKVKQFLN